MKINEIRLQFHFLTKIQMKMTRDFMFMFLFCFSFLLSLHLKSHLEAVLSKFKILSCTKGPFVIYA